MVLRLRRFHLLRPARAAHHRRHARQVAPLHRLDAPAAQPTRSSPTPSPTSPICATSISSSSADLEKRGRTDWMREEMDVLTSPDTYRMEPEHAWERLKTRVRKPQGACRADGGRRLARARGADARRAARRACSRTTSSATSPCRRRPRSSGSASLRSLPRGFERSRWGEAIIAAVAARARARSQDACRACERRSRRPNGAGHGRTAQGAAAHDVGAARRRREGDRHRRRPRAHRRRRRGRRAGAARAGGANCSATRRSRSSTASWRWRSRTARSRRETVVAAIASSGRSAARDGELRQRTYR